MDSKEIYDIPKKKFKQGKDLQIVDFDDDPDESIGNSRDTTDIINMDLYNQGSKRRFQKNKRNFGAKH